MAGVKLSSGGTVKNNKMLTGYLYGAEIYGGIGKVINSSAIGATGKFGDGVRLEDGGTVDDESGGSITATGAGGYGVFLQDGGVIDNASGASINGSGCGVVVEGATGTLSNSGSIVCANYDAVQMKDGGVITNTATGTITGGYRAIYIAGGVGHVTNAGTISAGTQGGIKMTAGGALTNTGTVDGDARILGGVGTVANSGSIGGVYLASGGTIANKAGATISTAYEAGVLLGYNGSKFTGGGALVNGAKAEVSGFSGVYGGESAATVTNSGTITGTKSVKASIAGVSRTFGDGVSLNAGGTVVNEAGASISGVRYGVYVNGSSAKVTNAADAAINGDVEGVRIAGVAGTVTNSGSITATTYAGVLLLDGGTVTNSASGTISGNDGSIEIKYGIGHVTNAGKISGAGDIVLYSAGGSVTNTGTIRGMAYIRAGTGTVTNSGSIRGVWLTSGGTVTNRAGGYIQGYDKYVGVILGMNGYSFSGGGVLSNAAKATIVGDSGVYAGGSAATVTNSGTIKGETDKTLTHSGVTEILGDGVSLDDGGAVTNKSGGSITGVRYGVYVKDGAGTITNAGTIAGKTTAIEFAGAGANALTLETGSVLTGSVVGSTAKGATNALTLTGKGKADNDFLNFGALSVDAAGTWTLGGVSAIAATTVSTGALAVTGALTTAITEDAATTVTIAGGHALTLDGASTLSGATEGNGTLAITAGDTTIDDGATITTGHWSILGTTAGVTLDAPGQFSYDGAFTAGSGAIIDMAAAAGAYFQFGSSGSAVFSGATLEGSETLFDYATTKISGLTVEGDAGFVADASLTQTGLVTLSGDGAAGVGNLGASSIWDITSNTGIALALGGSTALGFGNNGGLFEKTGGTGVSVVETAFFNYNGGEVLVSSGTLDIEGAVTGTGSDTISGAATLEFGSTVVDTQTIDFTGAGGKLDLGSPTGFAGVISGFDTTGSGDSIELLGNWKISGYTQSTSAEGTLTLGKGKESASLVFDGTYSKLNFDPVFSAGHTTITYA